MYLIIHDHPLFLPAAGLFGCRYAALDFVDSPAVEGSIFAQQIMWEHRQHKLSDDFRENFEQFRKILFTERACIVSTVATHVGGIHEVECLRAVVPLDHVFAIFALDGNVREALAQHFGKVVLGIEELEVGRTAAVVTERAVEHRGKAQL